jgi:hypothetical protein
MGWCALNEMAMASQLGQGPSLAMLYEAMPMGLTLGRLSSLPEGDMHVSQAVGAMSSEHGRLDVQ